VSLERAGSFARDADKELARHTAPAQQEQAGQRNREACGDAWEPRGQAPEDDRHSRGGRKIRRLVSRDVRSQPQNKAQENREWHHSQD
jgi:hypothetical protein